MDIGYARHAKAYNTLTAFGRFCSNWAENNKRYFPGEKDNSGRDAPIKPIQSRSCHWGDLSCSSENHKPSIPQLKTSVVYARTWIFVTIIKQLPLLTVFGCCCSFWIRNKLRRIVSVVRKIHIIKQLPLLTVFGCCCSFWIRNKLRRIVSVVRKISHVETHL